MTCRYFNIIVYNAKIVQAEHKENLFALLRRSLSSAKIVQNFDLASQMRIYSFICEREKFI
ncbi:hypothetical protein CJ232_10565 [Hoylesella timonensis]|uniref:Uncharacterized protein n=1 Tax=Hoylesella timonensis TaxID=386414 RepID=A0A2N6Q3D9_9BACT|nr:hypothetical protein CJ232_10565 [Hoylesella timonensis]